MSLKCLGSLLRKSIDIRCKWTENNCRDDGADCIYLSAFASAWTPHHAISTCPVQLERHITLIYALQASYNQLERPIALLKPVSDQLGPHTVEPLHSYLSYENLFA